MDLSLKTPMKPSEIPKSSSSSDSKQRLRSPKVEVDENDQGLNHHHSGSIPQSSKKPSSMTKNFMSPTVSAASKVSTPRKKILAERNEAFGSTFSDTHLPKRSTHASADLVSTPIRKLPTRVSESDDEGTCSLSQPYDPLTNYLSPRPQFLRYNPNRRLEILHRRESGGEQGNGDGLSSAIDASVESEKLVDTDADGSSSSSSQGEPVKQEEGSFSSEIQCQSEKPSEDEEASENEDEEDEEEEVEEEKEAKHEYFNKFLKFLMLLLVLTLSTMYVSSMNSPNPPPPLQALREFKQEYFKIQESFVGWGSSFFDQSHEETQDLSIEKEVVVGEELKEEMGVLADQLDGVLSGSEMDDGFMEETERVEEEWKQVDEIVVEEEEHLEEEMSEEEVPDQVVDDHLELNEREEPSEISEILQVSQIQIPTVSDQVDEISVLNEWEASEISESSQVPTDLMEEEVIVVGEEPEVISEVEVMEVQSPAHCEEEVVEDEMEETETAEVSESLEDPLQTNINKVFKLWSEAMETDFNVKLAVGVSLLMAFLVSMVLGCFRSRKPSAKDCSSTFKKPSFESRAVENNGYKSVFSKKEETVVPKKIEKVAESYLSPCSSVHSGGKYSKESSIRIQAPRVELLGEYVVEELNSSFRSCSLKPKTTVECEESHFSVSQEKQPRRKAVSSPVNREYSSLSGLSATESPYYGSFTVHETIVKKEEVISTPVRRSSRIRSKSVMSP